MSAFSPDLQSPNPLQPTIITQPTSSMTDKDILETMETLMSSMNSGNWSHIMPDQFYSLIDSLQGVQGLDQHDIDQLEFSYSNYLKFQGTFESGNKNNIKHSLVQPAHFRLGIAPDSLNSQHSPYQRSQAPQHTSYSRPQQPQLPSPQLSQYSTPSQLGSYASPCVPPPLMPGSVAYANNITCNTNHPRSSSLLENEVLQPVVYMNPLQTPNVSLTNFGNLNDSMMGCNAASISSENIRLNFNQRHSSADSSFLKPNLYANRHEIAIDDDDEDFDWSSIM